MNNICSSSHNNLLHLLNCHLVSAGLGDLWVCFTGSCLPPLDKPVYQRHKHTRYDENQSRQVEACTKVFVQVNQPTCAKRRNLSPQTAALDE